MSKMKTYSSATCASGTAHSPVCSGRRTDMRHVKLDESAGTGRTVQRPGVSRECHICWNATVQR